MESKYADYLRQAKARSEQEAQKGRDLVQEVLEIGDELIGKKGKISAYKIASKLDIGLSQAYLVKHKLESKS